MNALLLLYLLGMFDDKDSKDIDDKDLDYMPSGWFILGVIIFWILVIFVCWEVAKLL